MDADNLGFTPSDLGKLTKLLHHEGYSWSTHGGAEPDEIVFKIKGDRAPIMARLQNGSLIKISKVAITAECIDIMGSMQTVEEPQGPTVWTANDRSVNISELKSVEVEL